MRQPVPPSRFDKKTASKLFVKAEEEAGETRTRSRAKHPGQGLLLDAGAQESEYEQALLQMQEGTVSMNHQSTHPHGPRQRRARESSRQVWLANSRRRFPLLVSRIGPVTLSICSVLLMSLMAILYLSQQGQAVATNQQIQALRNQQTTLQRQNGDLVNTIATEQSPGYVAAFAGKMGLTPMSAQNVQVVNNPQTQSNGDQTNQP